MISTHIINTWLTSVNRNTTFHFSENQLLVSKDELWNNSFF